MALKAVIETLDGLSDSDKAHYEKKDDKFIAVITPASGYSLAEVEVLTATLSKERENARLASVKLTEFGDISPAKAKKAIEKMAEMINWKPDEKMKEQLEAVKADLVSQHSTAIAEKDTIIESLTNSTYSLQIEIAADSAIDKADGYKKMLMPHIKNATGMFTDANNKLVVIVKNPDGTPKLNIDGSFYTVESLVNDWKTLDDFAPAFKGSGSTGSGANGGSSGTSIAGAKTRSNAQFEEMSPMERANFFINDKGEIKKDAKVSNE